MKNKIMKSSAKIGIFTLLVVSIIVTIYISITVIADLSCSIQTGSCSSGTAILHMENSTGGYNNAHAELASQSNYNNYLCCETTGKTLTTTCDTIFLELSATSNAHVQDPASAATPDYTEDACIGNATGSCQTESGSCSAGYTCLLSMASSEGDNQTNAHVANCSYYDLQVCCHMNSPPTQSKPVLNATSNNNLTTDNITCYANNIQDTDGDPTTAIYNWWKNDEPIMILNMPFDTNVSSTTEDAVNDYSGYDNHGTIGGGTASYSPTWTSSGKIGGAYNFTAQDQRIIIEKTSNLVLADDPYSVEMWVRFDFMNWNARLFTQGKSLTSSAEYYMNGPEIWIRKDGNPTYNNALHFGVVYAPTYKKDTAYIIQDWQYDQWYHFVFVWDGDDQHIYVNGTEYATSLLGDTVTDPHEIDYNYSIGADYIRNDRSFNGTMDEFRIYNYSLSSEQVHQRWLETKDGYSNNRTIVSQETTKGDIWKCELTPNDGYEDGTSDNSSALTIGNAPPPKVILSYPKNDDDTFTNRTPKFNWTAVSDADGDSINYTLNISLAEDWSVPFDSVADIENNYYIYTPEMSFQTYYWKVRAYDGEEYGEWSDIWNFTLVTYVDVNLTVAEVNFGNVIPTQQYDTTGGSPSPFIIENIGNTESNVTINATGLWESDLAPLDTTYYQFKLDTYSGWNSFDSGLSQTSWEPFSLTAKTLIAYFNHTDGNDKAEIDIGITVPQDEPATTKTSNVTVYVGLA